MGFSWNGIFPLLLYKQTQSFKLFLCSCYTYYSSSIYIKLLSKIKKYLNNSHTTNNKAQEDFIIEIYREEDEKEEVKKFSNRYKNYFIRGQKY